MSYHLIVNLTEKREMLATLQVVFKYAYRFWKCRKTLWQCFSNIVTKNCCDLVVQL